MKYKDTTQEQRESMTPILKEMFDFMETKRWRNNDDYWLTFAGIKAYQQAQKAEIEHLESQGRYYDQADEERLAKLKFESELE